MCAGSAGQGLSLSCPGGLGAGVTYFSGKGLRSRREACRWWAKILIYGIQVKEPFQDAMLRPRMAEFTREIHLCPFWLYLAKYYRKGPRSRPATPPPVCSPRFAFLVRNLFSPSTFPRSFSGASQILFRSYLLINQVNIDWENLLAVDLIFPACFPESL